MKIILHIGQSKTGTSAIQSFLTLNRLALRDQGVLYPNIKKRGFTIDIASHNAVADALLGQKMFPYLSADEYFQQFFKQAKDFNAHTMILSAEHFVGGQPRVFDVQNEKEYFQKYEKKIYKLAQYLQGHEIEIILYLRPQVDWFASSVSQTIRIEGLMSKKKIYQNDRQFLELMKPLLNYSKLVDMWSNVMKPDRLQIIPYTRENLFKESSISDFLKRVNLENLSLPNKHEHVTVNASISREFIELKKEFNKRERSSLEERLIIKCMEQLSVSSKYGDKYKLNDDIVSWIENYACSQNDYINQTYNSTKTALTSIGTYRGQKLPEIKREEIQAAKNKFEQTFNSFQFRILRVKFAVTSFLRIHLPFIHGALHQIKRLIKKH